jgi:hypothetical protein
MTPLPPVAPPFGKLASVPPSDGFDAGAFDRKLVEVIGTCRAGGAVVGQPGMNSLLRGAVRTTGMPGFPSRAPVAFQPPSPPLQDAKYGLVFLETMRLLGGGAPADPRFELRESRSPAGSLLEVRATAAHAAAQGLAIQEASVRVQGLQMFVTLRAARASDPAPLECTFRAYANTATPDPR